MKSKMAGNGQQNEHVIAYVTHLWEEDRHWRAVPPRVNVTIVKADVSPITFQIDGVDAARAEVSRMAADRWYANAGPFTAVFLRVGEQAIYQYTRTEMDELARLRSERG